MQSDLRKRLEDNVRNEENSLRNWHETGIVFLIGLIGWLLCRYLEILDGAPLSFQLFVFSMIGIVIGSITGNTWRDSFWRNESKSLSTDSIDLINYKYNELKERKIKQQKTTFFIVLISVVTFLAFQ
jgi:hypothetical protein